MIKCDDTCSTCNGSTINSCTSCSLLDKRELSSGLCICKERYFESSSKCVECHYSCLTCSDTTYDCVTCSSNDNRVQSGSKCKCEDAYYDIVDTHICGGKVMMTII
jgi:hypothetical protein